MVCRVYSLMLRLDESILTSTYKFTSPYITIVQIIFYFLWDHWAHCGILENGVLHMYTLEGVSSVANFITAYEKSQ